MIIINNIYGHRFGARQRSRLDSLGFRIRPQVSTYMGAQLCRFIDFERGPCLELIVVEDDRAYRDFLPAGMDAYCPGISLALPHAGTIARYEREFEHLRPYRLHVTYNGTSGSRGPGWHYLNFGVPVVPGTFIWLTAYDEPRPVEERLSHHPNTVKGLEGIVFDLEMDDLRAFRLLADGEGDDGPFCIGDVMVWSRDALEGTWSGRDKRFPLVAVVLRAETLDGLPLGEEGVRRCSFMGQSAVHIATNPRSWDVVVIA